ncbi:MAG: hypothetical protein MJA30_31350 [Cytophagales bacterium]|nr:hypothetical protein [Cytophagales bacterium]
MRFLDFGMVNNKFSVTGKDIGHLCHLGILVFNKEFPAVICSFVLNIHNVIQS